MGTKPVYALAGLFVAGVMLSGCRSNSSIGGADRTPTMIGQSQTYGTPTTVGQRGMSPATRTPMATESGYGRVPAGATSYQNVTTVPAQGGNTASYSTPNAFGGAATTTMPATAGYQMPAGAMQNTMPAQPQMPQTIGADVGRPAGTTTSQYRTEYPPAPQIMAPGGSQQ